MRQVIGSLVLTVFSVTGLLSQVQFSGTIVNGNGNPIPYVNIGIPSKGIGTVSDHNGIYNIDFASPGDTVVISVIGYEMKVIPYAIISQSPRVILKEKDYDLPVVQIKSSRIKIKPVVIGSRNKTRGHSIGFGSKQLGSEIGAQLYFEHYTEAESMHFVVNHAKGDSMHFRLKIYQILDGKIGQQVMRQAVYVREAQRKGEFSLDLQPYELKFKGKYLVSLEWIENINGISNQGLSFDTKSDRKNGGTYMRLSSMGKMEKVPYLNNKRPCFYIKGKAYITD